jgi:DNA oxidative demethylase
MPAAFIDIALPAAAEAGFANYDPDACLINRYIAGAKLSLHQDRDEKDAWAPIVSLSLGSPAAFLWGGKRRSDPVRRLHLESGDIAVWGGPARFVYHGVVAQGRAARADRRRSHQSYLPKGILMLSAVKSGASPPLGATGGSRRSPETANQVSRQSGATKSVTLDA